MQIASITAQLSHYYKATKQFVQKNPVKSALALASISLTAFFYRAENSSIHPFFLQCNSRSKRIQYTLVDNSTNWTLAMVSVQKALDNLDALVKSMNFTSNSTS